MSSIWGPVQYLEEAERLDALEDGLYGDEEDGEDPELKTREGREKRKAELKKREEKAERDLEHLQAEEAPSSKRVKRLNTTDPDARLMKMKRGDFANGYNVQIMTENGIVLTSFVSNNSADQHTLVPSVQKLEALHNKIPKRLLADKGYSTEVNYTFCEERGVDAYIPVSKQQIRLADYTHDQELNTYTDNEGRVFVFKQHADRLEQKATRGRPKKTQKQHTYKATIYEYRDPTTGKKHYLKISHLWQSHIKKQKEKFSTHNGKQIYKQRMHDVEGVFARIKHHLNFTRFQLRGFEGVRNEWTLISLAHNLKKIL
jgi:hypothetical protein